MKLAGVALLTGLLPIIAVHATYLIAASHGHIDWCFPYIDSCTSISATGRKPPEFYVFKGLMIPAAMVMMLFWILSYAWLKAEGLADRFAGLLPLIGIIGCIALILYATVLGAPGDLLRLQRRLGVIIYFTFTYLAELMLLKYILQQPFNPGNRIRIALLCLMGGLLALGVLSLILGVFMPDYDTIEDSFEWVMALLIHVYFLVLFVLWRDRSFTVSFQTAYSQKRKGAEGSSRQ